jgi:hypothetical protein
MKIPADVEHGLKQDSSNRMAPHSKKSRLITLIYLMLASTAKVKKACT